MDRLGGIRHHGRGALSQARQGQVTQVRHVKVAALFGAAHAKLTGKVDIDRGLDRVPAVASILGAQPLDGIGAQGGRVLGDRAQGRPYG